VFEQRDNAFRSILLFGDRVRRDLTTLESWGGRRREWSAPVLGKRRHNEERGGEEFIQ
jgi:hypothetical protein